MSNNDLVLRFKNYSSLGRKVVVVDFKLGKKRVYSFKDAICCAD